MFSNLELVTGENEFINVDSIGKITPCRIKSDNASVLLDRNKITIIYKLFYESISYNIPVYYGTLQTGTLFTIPEDKSIIPFYIDGFSLDVYRKFEDYLKEKIPKFTIKPIPAFIDNEKVETLSIEILKKIVT